MAVNFIKLSVFAAEGVEKLLHKGVFAEIPLHIGGKVFKHSFAGILAYGHDALNYEYIRNMAGNNLRIKLGYSRAVVIAGIVLGIIRHTDAVFGIGFIEIQHLLPHVIIEVHTGNVDYFSFIGGVIFCFGKLYKLRLIFSGSFVIACAYYHKVSDLHGDYSVYIAVFNV